MKKIFSSKLIFIITLAVQILVFVIVLSKNVILKNNAIENNRIYSFDCSLYDPYNVLKGRYVRLVINQENASIKDFDAQSKNEENVTKLLKNEKVYLLIKPDADGLWKVYGVRKNKPKSGDFIKARVNYCYSETANFDFSISEYYMQENFAEYVDNFGFRNISSMKIEVYCDKNGNLLQKQLYVNDNASYLPIEDFIKSKISK